MSVLTKIFINILFVGVSVGVANNAMAAWTMPQWAVALGNTANIFSKLVLAFSYLLGIFFTIRAVMAFKHAGQSNMMGGGGDNAHLMSALVNLFIGVVFLYLPQFVQLMLITFYNQPSLLAYSSLGFSSSQFDDLINVLAVIIKLIGLIAFIRGWLLLVRLGSHGGAQPGTVPKAIMHIIGGLLAINIFGTIQLLGKMIKY